jgi:LacI family transcriptional regulator
VDGLIIVTCRMADALLLRYSATAPIVVAGRDLRRGNLFSMKMDNVLGGRLATRHLVDLGHRRIALLQGPSDHIDALDRVEGYRRALREARVPVDPELIIPAGFFMEDGLEAVNRLLDAGRKFTAIFAANDECAYGAHLALHRRGIRVPRDVSLVGFDDLPGSSYTIPPLTTVRQPLEEIGRRVAHSMLDLLHGRKPSTEDMPEVELVIRDTTARLA